MNNQEMNINQNQQQTEQTQEKKEKYNLNEFARFNVKGEASMKTTAFIEFISGKDLSIKITTFLRKVFADYKATTIYYDTKECRVKVILWFSPAITNSSAGERAIEENNLETNSGKWARDLMNTNTILNGKAQPYKLTKYGKFILGTLIGQIPNKVNWNKHIGFQDEVAGQNIYNGRNGRETLMKVEGCDLSKILSIIYGDTKEVDYDSRNSVHKLSYNVIYAKDLQPPTVQYSFNPLYGYVPVNDLNYQDVLLQILCFDENMMNELRNILGVNMPVINIPMY